LYGGLCGGSDGGYSVSTLWYLLGWLVDQGGVANLKTVPIYQGVTDVFLRQSHTTDYDEALASFVVADNGSIAATLVLISI
jgi:hypothetical protein